MGLESLPFRLDVVAAHAAIAPFIRRTPLVHVPELQPDGGPRVSLKLESLQVTGSFKARGAANCLLALSPEERRRGVVACSSGNHGRAVAYIAARLGVSAVLCVPKWVDPVKLQAMKNAGARVLLAGETYDEAEAEASALAEAEGRVFVQPFDDPLVVAGQGTIGLELMEDLPRLSTVLVPLSGGGLAGGIAYALKAKRPEVRVVAVSAERARVMYESVRRGEPVSLAEEETIAEALSGGIGSPNRYTFRLIRDLVDEHVVVTEEETVSAVLYALRSLNLVVEGGGAVALAAVLRAGGTPLLAAEEGDAVVIVSGGNISLARLAALEASTEGNSEKTLSALSPDPNPGDPPPP